MPIPKSAKCKSDANKMVCVKGAAKAPRKRAAAVRKVAAAAAVKHRDGCSMKAPLGERRCHHEGEPRNTIPKMRDNSSGRMFHETIHLGGRPIASGSPYDGRAVVPVRPVGRMQAPEMQSGSNPLAIRTSGMESGT